MRAWFLPLAGAAALLALGSAADEGSAADAQPEPLTPLAAIELSRAAGEAVFAEREQGHCVLCHRIDALPVPFQGNVGPALDGIGSRLSPAKIRYRIVDASRLNPETIMPPYYRTEGLSQVAEAYRGRPALSAEQIELVVHYLAGLRE